MSTAGTWFKDNLFVVAAIALPILVTCLFALATVLPRYWVDDPQYDLLVSLDRHTQNQRPYQLELSVADGRLQAHAVSDRPNRYYSNQAELYRFNTRAGTLTPIDIPVGDIRVQQDGRTPIELPEELQKLELLTESMAPDGYHFRHRYGGSPGLFGELFGMGSRRQVIAVEKDGRVLDVNTADKGRYRYYYNVEFLGWIDR